MDDLSALFHIFPNIVPIELYCGNGHHSIAITKFLTKYYTENTSSSIIHHPSSIIHHPRILGIEINPNLVSAAYENKALNDLTERPILYICCSSEHVNKAMEEDGWSSPAQVMSLYGVPVGKYRDVDYGRGYQFSTVIVDPPRAGMDDG